MVSLNYRDISWYGLMDFTVKVASKVKQVLSSPNHVISGFTGVLKQSALDSRPSGPNIPRTCNILYVIRSWSSVPPPCWIWIPKSPT